jgi:hypothetical protein
MPSFHFKLVDGNIVSDYGTHELDDETSAQIEALKLARSLSETRPEFATKNCVLVVTDENGAMVRDSAWRLTKRARGSRH